MPRRHLPQLGELGYEEVFWQSPLAWSITGPDGRGIIANDAYCRLFGYSPDELTAMSVLDYTHPDDRDRTNRYLDKVISGAEHSHQTVKRFQRKDGTEFLGSVTITALTDAEGAVVGLLGVVADVTVQQRLEAEIAGSERRLAKLLASISDTVTLVNADEQVVMTTGQRKPVMGYPRSVWDGLRIFDLLHPDDLERGRAMVDLVLASTGAELTDEFRLRHADGHWEHVEVTAVNLLDDEDMRGVVLTTRNVTVRRQAELAAAAARDEAITAAARLHDSAVDWAGRLALVAATLPLDGPAGSVTAQVRAELATLRDEMDAVARIVEGRPSEPTDPTRRAPATAAASTSTVRHDVPAPSGAAEEHRARPLLLVVEDNHVNQVLVQEQLGRLGYDCVVVGSGEEALERRPELTIAAILMDWQLPGIDGLETTRRLRQREGASTRVPIIAMTASAAEGDRAACLDAGMDDFCPKPLSLASLGEALTRWVGVTSGSATASAPQAVSDDGADGPVVDPDVLAHLAEELDDVTLVRSLVQRYLDELDDRVAALGQGLRAGDGDEAGRAAHTLRSTSELLGAVGLAAACRTARDDAEAQAQARAAGDEHGPGDRAAAVIDDLTARTRHQLVAWLAL